MSEQSEQDIKLCQRHGYYKDYCVQCRKEAQSEQETPTLPKPLYSCYLCREDYSWPPEDLYLSKKVNQWICENCWEDEEHGEKAANLDAVIGTREQKLERELAKAELELELWITHANEHSARLATLEAELARLKEEREK